MQPCNLIGYNSAFYAEGQKQHKLILYYPFDCVYYMPFLLSKCKTSGTSGNSLDKECRELNEGQPLLEWKIFTLKRV